MAAVPAPAGEEIRMNQRVWVLGILLLALIGCATPQTRLQKEDEADQDKEVKVRTIGDVGVPTNTQPAMAYGVGLVINLEGTGGGAPPGPYRTMLEDYLRKRSAEHIKELLASKDVSLVLVSAVIPPGAHKGDPVDVAITLPRESRTTSLRGGRLLECDLHEYTTRKMIDPQREGLDKTLQGHVVARAEGQLQVGHGENDATGQLREAHIWGGGRALVTRPFYLVLNGEKQSARMAKVIADRINGTFHGPFQATAGEIARAEKKSLVLLTVPPQYRLNQPRYLRVVRLIPIEESEASQIAYRRRLEVQLLDPKKTIVAALRLEALGPDSIPTLKQGLKSEHPLVRFAAAEALAYLGSPSCGEQLARLVEEQPALRAFCLTALASLDEAICHVELRKLLESPSTETRYGAFRALRGMDETEEAIQGELLNDSFWLHRVAPGSMPVVHMTTSNRPEIVLFGDDIVLAPPFSILAGGEFTVTAGPNDDHSTITHISLRNGRSTKQCSLKLEDTLRTLALLGGTYSDAMEVVRHADRQQCLNCRVGVDALPQATSVLDLARAGAGDSELLQTHPEIIEARADFGTTPNLFDRGQPSHKRAKVDVEDADDEAGGKDSPTREGRNGSAPGK
jgi:flagellar basal body P-ring protein FlgI